MDDGIAEAMRSAALAGAALVAAHPNSVQDRRSANAESPVAQTLERRSLPTLARGRATERFSRDAGLRELAHRFELFNRSQMFGWVAEAGLPAVACGDLHEPGHLFSWKTLVPSRHDEETSVDYLRSPRPVYITRLDAELSFAAA